MNKICNILILALVTSFTSYGQVNFEDISLEEALEKAKKEDKKVFVDVYTSWCAPCKAMVAEVFSDKLVGERMSKDYIAIKIDKEKSPNRKEVSKYNVKGYPTMLILDPRGLELGRIYGYRPLDAFNKEVETYIKVKNHPIVNAIEAMKEHPNDEAVWKKSLHLLGKNWSLLYKSDLKTAYKDACENYYRKFEITKIEGDDDLLIFKQVLLPLEHPVVQFYMKDSIDYGSYFHIRYMVEAFKNEVKKAESEEGIDKIKLKAGTYYDYCFKVMYGDMEEKSVFMDYIFEGEKEKKSETKETEKKEVTGGNESPESEREGGG
jgi:thioredoxin-related protein